MMYNWSVWFWWSICHFFSLQSEIGFGKMETYIKLEKLGEVRMAFSSNDYSVICKILCKFNWNFPYPSNTCWIYFFSKPNIFNMCNNVTTTQLFMHIYIRKRKRKAGELSLELTPSADMLWPSSVGWLFFSDRQDYSVDGNTMFLMIALGLVSSWHGLGVGTLMMD